VIKVFFIYDRDTLLLFHNDRRHRQFAILVDSVIENVHKLSFFGLSIQKTYPSASWRAKLRIMNLLLHKVLIMLRKGLLLQLGKL
jgi:hypothetical protein